MMNATRSYSISFLAGLLCFAGIANSAAPTGGDTQQNILMIVLDDLNDCIGVLGGHPQADTPNIDRLARQGVLFENAHSNVGVCSPSRASFMTGIHPAASGCWGFGSWYNYTGLMNSKTLGEMARENGYHALAAGKVLHTSKPYMWDKKGVRSDYGPMAFDGKKRVPHPDAPPGMVELGALDATFTRLSNVPAVPPSENAPGYNGWMGGAWGQKKPFRYVSETDRDSLHDEQVAAWFEEQMQRFERKKEKQPFFIATGLIRPPTPMVVPDSYFDLFPLDQLELPKRLQGDIEDTPAPRDSRGKQAFDGLVEAYDSTEAALRVYLQAYLASVKFADDQVGTILNALDRSPYADTTTVLLFSDHGYHLSEKDQIWKYTLWEEGTRVPLIIRDPRFSRHAGARVSHPVSLIDVYPTIMELAAWRGDNAKNANGLPLNGASLAPFLENPRTTDWAGPDAALSMAASWRSKAPAGQNLSIRTERYRYTRYPGKGEELYDHQRDPHEWTNLANHSEHQNLKMELSAQLDEQLKGYLPPPRKAGKQAAATSGEKEAAERWKDTYFGRHPEADANKDGTLTWPEYHAHKKKRVAD